MATVRLLTAVPTSGTSSQLHALAVKSHTLMFPCWSPVKRTDDWPSYGPLLLNTLVLT